MKKGLFVVLCLFTFLLMNEAEARTCREGIPSPPIYYNGSWTYELVTPMTTTASSCKASNMYVYFSDGSWGSNHYIEFDAYLMESDPDGNEDEIAKEYYGENYAASTDWTLETTHSGNLDSAGDQVCELYMKFRVRNPKVSNNYQYYEADLFRYTICID